MKSIEKLENLVGTTGLWVSKNGAWVAGQLPIEADPLEILTPPNGSRSPVYLVARTRYRLVDRANGTISREDRGTLLAPPTDDGKVCVLRGDPPELAVPAKPPIAVPTRRDGTLVHLVAGFDCRRFVAVFRRPRDRKSYIVEWWLVMFDETGAVHWDHTIASLNAVAVADHAGVVAVASGEPTNVGPAGFTFLDGETGALLWRTPVPGSWEGVRSLALSPEGTRAYGVNWRDLFILDLERQEVENFRAPTGTVRYLLPCGDHLMLLSSQELGSDSAAMYGFANQGTLVQLHEFDLASGMATAIEEPRLSRDEVAALACYGDQLLLPIGR